MIFTGYFCLAPDENVSSTKERLLVIFIVFFLSVMYLKPELSFIHNRDLINIYGINK